MKQLSVQEREDVSLQAEDAMSICAAVLHGVPQGSKWLYLLHLASRTDR